MENKAPPPTLSPTNAKTDMIFTPEEKKELSELYARLLRHAPDERWRQDAAQIRAIWKKGMESGLVARDAFHLNPAIRAMGCAVTAIEETGMRRGGLLAILLKDCVTAGAVSLLEVEQLFHEEVTGILEGLLRIQEVQQKSSTVESENFKKFLLTLAQDFRVILILISDRVDLMRRLRDTTEPALRDEVCKEASLLYAPLAHKLGLYRLKNVLEDLHLKYTQPDIYYQIRDKLQQTKSERDAYIKGFIDPLEELLRAEGLRFHIKGRTKSIHSIYQKMRKQHCGFENVYDLFAIRIIIDAPPETEKQQCWQAYSLVTDLYQPNPSRLRDWISVPKSNGYESLHITVLGPQVRWVEVQIRSERMDDVAERGLAAHWRYKGVSGGSGGLDSWLNSVRELLESGQDELETVNHLKADLYKDEVFVFTPKGEVVNLPQGATVLDFAFSIHTRVGSQCQGARIGGRVVPIRQKLKSGDQVEILTSPNQSPSADWLSVVTTSKARTRIRQALKEALARQTRLAREELERRFKNRKIDYDESVMMRLIKRLGYKINTEFYQAVASGGLDPSKVIEAYQELVRQDSTAETDEGRLSAESFSMDQDLASASSSQDVLVIDEHLKGVQYELARCCCPIYGDPVFGFVSSQGGIKIHRKGCPNEQNLRERYPYRVVRARWSGKAEGSRYAITLLVVGQDDIGIVTNITSIIKKEEGTQLRSIRIDTQDGLFSGYLTIATQDTSKLDALVKKIKAIKGVKNVQRT